MIIGITGGVGAGKSSILSYLQKQYKAKLLVADDMAKALLKPGGRALEEIRKLFPDNLFDEKGAILREQMADFIFHNPQIRSKQNEIVFPLVKEEIKKEIARCDCDQLIVIEAALLIEEHYDEICDVMWYIYSSEEKRRERLRSSRGYSEERITSMFCSQLSEEEFREHCDVVIDNDGDIEATYDKIRQILNA